MISAALTAALAQRLDAAQSTCTEIPSLADGNELGVDDAYAIQAALVGRRESRGERVVGFKLGFTSRAKMAQMGISEVVVGRLTDRMRVADGADVQLSQFIHPKVEPEIAYRLCRDVDPDDPAADIESCVDGMAPAMEIIDSRYRNFRFTHTDVVADNASASGYAIGPWHPFEQAANRAVLLRSGTREEVGSTAAILGDPVRALRALHTVCRLRSIALCAGQVVLAGAATAALPLAEGVSECRVAGLGTVKLRGR